MAIAITEAFNPIDSTLTMTEAAPSFIKAAASAVIAKIIQNMVNSLSVTNDYGSHHDNQRRQVVSLTTRHSKYHLRGQLAP